MILTLVFKEWKLRGQGGSLSSRVLRGILSVLSFCLVFAGILYLYMQIEGKIAEFSKYPTSDFLIFYLFLAFVASSLLCLEKARASLFDKKDKSLLSPLPVSPDQIVMAKCVYLYMSLVIYGLALFTSALFGYGLLHSFTIHYYIFSFLFPFFIAIPSLALVGLLVLPYKLAYDFLKAHPFYQIIIASVFVILLCFVYQFVLDFFLSALLESRTDLTALEPLLSSLHSSAPFLYPCSSLFYLFTGEGDPVFHLFLVLGIMIFMGGIGYMVLASLYKKAQDVTYEAKVGKIKKPKALTPTRALLKKESIILFRSSNYLFSFTSLLIMQPFLSFVVLSSLTQILYVQVKAYVTYFPGLTDGISLLIILLFSSIIAGAASDGYTREGKGRLYLRQIPVPPLKQSLIKASLPFAASFLSLLLSLIVLVSFSLIDASLFFAALFIGLILLSALAVLGLDADAARLAIVKRKIGGYASVLISLGLPLLLAALHFVLVFLTGFPTSLMYVLEIILACLVALPALLSFFLKNRRMIPEMRVDVL